MEKLMLILFTALSSAHAARVDEEYPESKFGGSEVTIKAGVGRGYASEAVRELAEPETGRNRLPPMPELRGHQEQALIVNDLGFFPSTVFVNRGNPVRLFVTGASRQSLCFMQDDHGIRKQIRAQKVEEITFTPQSAGIYRFYCPVNGMEGKLVVRDLVDQSSTPARRTASIAPESYVRHEDEIHAVIPAGSLPPAH